MSRRSTLFAAMVCVRLTTALSPAATSLRLRAAATKFQALSRRTPSAAMMMSSAPPLAPDKHVLVAVADGSEEIETTTIVDTLVHAGARVTLASAGGSLQAKQHIYIYVCSRECRHRPV